MKMKTKMVAVLGLAVVAGLSSCKKDDDLVATPAPTINEVEVITTLELTFTDAAGVQPTVTAKFRDPDGDGSMGPDVFDDIVLQANTTYNVTIALLNEIETPAEDIGAEVLEEDDEHLFCFTVAGGANLNITRTDSDGTFEVGLTSDWVTGAASTGTTQVVLKHQPGVKDGTCAPGETDIDVTFDTTIQ